MGDRACGSGVGLPEATAAELEYWALHPPRDVADCSAVVGELCRAVSKLSRDVVMGAHLGSVQSILAPTHAGLHAVAGRTEQTPEPSPPCDAAAAPAAAPTSARRHAYERGASGSSPHHRTDASLSSAPSHLRISPAPPGEQNGAVYPWARPRVVATTRTVPLTDGPAGHRYAPAADGWASAAAAPGARYTPVQCPADALAFTVGAGGSPPHGREHRYAPSAGVSVGDVSVPSSIGDLNPLVRAACGDVGDETAAAPSPIPHSHSATATPVRTPHRTPSGGHLLPVDAARTLGISSTADARSLRDRVNAALDRYDLVQSASYKRQYWSSGR